MSTEPNLANLSFVDIKESLTDYLKNQTVFSGYDVEGSAIQSVIDLLAYNTYYYAFYSNMISSELFLDSATRASSLVSLVKPLGYTIPGKKSASAKVITSSDVSAYTTFYGYLSNGVNYSFYNQDAGSAEVSLILTEGTLVKEKNITDLINVETQTYTLNDKNVDISTIRITVDGTVWKNVNHFPNNTEFYIERNENIFNINFGQSTSGPILITYLISSGIIGNGINAFASSGQTVVTQSKSSGGSNEPNIELIKFIAPKIFSSQGRAITKNDYVALLLENQFFTNSNAFVIYGGEELTPPRYGRVFISYENEADPTEILEFLKKKTTLGILPEYVIPNKIQIECEASVIFAEGVNGALIRADIINIFNSLSGGTENTFNRSFIFSEFKETVLSKYPSQVLMLSFDDMIYKTTLTKQINEFSIENSILNYGTAITDNFTSITGINNTKIKVPIQGSSALLIAPLDNKIDEVGSVDFVRGIFRINKIWNTTTLTVSIHTKNNIVSPITKSLSTLTLNINP